MSSTLTDHTRGQEMKFDGSEIDGNSGECRVSKQIATPLSQADNKPVDTRSTRHRLKSGVWSKQNRQGYVDRSPLAD